MNFKNISFMRIKAFYLLSLVSFLIAGCSDDDDSIPAFEVPQTEYKDISYEGTDLNIDFAAYDGWVATCDAHWCRLSATEGMGNGTLKVKVLANIEGSRSATITLRTQKESREIKLSQNGLPEGEEFHYKLPIVFHVIYNNPNDKRQNIPAERLNEILAEVNRLYKKAGDNSVDMNLEFVPATVDPQGNVMEEPGIDRIKWVSAMLNMQEFMFGSDRKYNHFLWDPNEYVNVCIYTFDLGDVMGVSTFPYSPASNPLPGTESVQYTAIKLENLKYAYCVSLNNAYVYSIGDLFGYPISEYQTDMGVTLAHELGHYLGLRHAFSESSAGCDDTDYCTDTPTYDKTSYETDLLYAMQQWVKDPSYRTDDNFYALFNRSNCKGEEFVSHNIMDYAYTYLDQFTPQQRDRVRHVLEYSPLIPGPKKGGTQSFTRTASGPIDLPITVMDMPEK